MVEDVQRVLAEKEREISKLKLERLAAMKQKAERVNREQELGREYDAVMARLTAAEAQLAEVTRLNVSRTLERDRRTAARDHALKTFQIIDVEHIAFSLDFNSLLNNCRDLTRENADLRDRLAEQEKQYQTLLTEAAAAAAKKPTRDSCMGFEIIDSDEPQPTAKASVAPRSLLRRWEAGESTDLTVHSAAAGDVIITAGADRRIKLWDPQGRCTGTLSGHSGAVSCVAASPSGDLVASGSADKAVLVWGMLTGRSQFKLVGHTEKIQACAFAAGGAHIFSSSPDRTIKVWDAARGVVECSLLCASVANGLCRDDTPSMFYSAHHDRSVRHWDWRLATKRPTHEVPTAHTLPILSAVLVPGSTGIIVASKDNTLSLFDIRAFKSVQQYRDDDFRVGPLGCKPCISPDGMHVAAGGDKGGLFVWSLRSGLLVSNIPVDRGAAIAACGWTSSNEVFTCGADKMLSVWGAR